LVIAGKEYGSGSSRDWAAKGSYLLNIKAVLAESFERIHRSNLIGMGILPMEFLPGENRVTLGLTGYESYSIDGIHDIQPHKRIKIQAKRPNGETTTLEAIARLDNDVEVAYYKHGGILPYVLRRLLAS
jgi:aconitate hydratase